MDWLLYWHWLALALVLIIAETLGAAGFLLAIGMAAATTGIITGLLAISWQWQILSFSILSILFAIAWWFFLKQRAITHPTLLNKPLETLVGRTAFLIDGIENGRGKISMNDAFWQVTGPELPKGSKVKIIAVQDGTLVVELA